MVFKSGRSGNPSGRPRGAKDRRTIFRDMVEPSCPRLIQKAIEMALDGNEQMLKLFLERVLPAKPKDEPLSLNLGTESLSEQANDIFLALSRGLISPSDTLKIMQLVALEAKIFEVDKLKSAVERLEGIIEHKMLDE